VAFAEMLLGKDCHPFAFRVETNLFGKFVLVKYFPDFCFVYPPLHVRYENVDQSNFSLLSRNLVIRQVYKFVKATAAENDCFEHLPRVFMLDKLFGFVDWNRLTASQMDRFNVYFCIR
jgi:hypothetical protein